MTLYCPICGFVMVRYGTKATCCNSTCLHSKPLPASDSLNLNMGGACRRKLKMHRKVQYD